MFRPGKPDEPLGREKEEIEKKRQEIQKQMEKLKLKLTDGEIPEEVNPAPAVWRDEEEEPIQEPALARRKAIVQEKRNDRNLFLFIAALLIALVYWIWKTVGVD